MCGAEDGSGGSGGSGGLLKGMVGRGGRIMEGKRHIDVTGNSKNNKLNPQCHFLHKLVLITETGFRIINTTCTAL